MISYNANKMKNISTQDCACSQCRMQKTLVVVVVVVVVLLLLFCRDGWTKDARSCLIAQKCQNTSHSIVYNYIYIVLIDN